MNQWPGTVSRAASGVEAIARKSDVTSDTYAGCAPPGESGR
jgi:hypothetical protein